MASVDPRLPEGTDHIIDDGSDFEDDLGLDLDGDDDGAAAETAAPLDEPEESAPEVDAAAPAANSAGSAKADKPASEPFDIRTAFFDKFEELRGQATERGFAFAQTGKDRATGLIDDAVSKIEDAAAEIDAKVGTQYGDYARRAAETLGGYSDSFKSKDVEDLFADARALVNKSPAVAIGAAAALGFVVARLVRASVPVSDDARSA